MKFKAILLHPITLFVLGILVAIGGLALNDYYSQPTAKPAPPSRVAAPRAPTSTASPTEPVIAFMEPSETASIASDATPTLETVALNGDATPTLEMTPTATSTGTLSTATAIVTTTLRRPTNTPLVRVTSTPTATLATRFGGSPYDALDFSIPDTWQTLDANKSIWYKIGERTSYPIGFQVWLDTYTKSGIGFSVFSPEQANGLNVATTPKGRGSFSKFTGHDLFWVGKSANAGVWYVLVTNSNPVPVQYKLTSSLKVGEHKNCRSYWEYLDEGRGPLVYWTWCE